MDRTAGKEIVCADVVTDAETQAPEKDHGSESDTATPGSPGPFLMPPLLTQRLVEVLQHRFGRVEIIISHGEIRTIHATKTDQVSP